MQFEKFRIAARGLIIRNKCILFVSDDGHYWYLPGGRLEGGESLPDCVEREVYEETGFLVKAQELCYVQERLDLKDNIHKIHFYFHTKILKENSEQNWFDTGGTVQYHRFFSLDEIRTMKTILPRFLSRGEWCNFKENEGVLVRNPSAIYQGAVKVRGFELVDEE